LELRDIDILDTGIKIKASGKNVFVTWLERSQAAATSIPVMKIGNDNGKH
jgi:hypothetical protein